MVVSCATYCKTKGTRRFAFCFGFVAACCHPTVAKTGRLASQAPLCSGVPFTGVLHVENCMGAWRTGALLHRFLVLHVGAFG